MLAPPARVVVSATTPFGSGDLPELRRDAAAVVRRLLPAYEDLYAARGWRMFPVIDRVYVNAAARADLGWRPVYDFAQVVADLAAGRPLGSDLAREVGIKGYHAETFADGPYPVE